MTERSDREAAVARATVTEYEYEPIPGLPEVPPEGEEILWQGAPRASVLARRAFHARKVGVYFALMATLSLYWDLSDGASLAQAIANLAWLAVAGATAIGLLVILARSMARSTLYTITNRRVVMRFGVAIPMTLNLPYGKVASAALRENGDGTGDIPLAMTRSGRVPYWVLWPHARPWHLAPAQPMLRAIPDAARAAHALAGALEAYAAEHGAAQDPRPAESEPRGVKAGGESHLRAPAGGLTAH